jgi:hypothetical protein
VEKRIVEREFDWEHSPTTSWLGEYCPLRMRLSFGNLITYHSGQRLNQATDSVELS